MFMEVLFHILRFALVFVPIALVPVMIFLERKGAAVIQDRPGPNRAALKLPVLGQIRGFGMVHNFTDMIKLLFKEEFVPAKAHKWYYTTAPMIPVATALITPALIPWFADVSFQRADDSWVSIAGSFLVSDASLLLLFAVSSLSVYGIVLGSWGSNSKFSLLGGLRSSAMMISYEVAMGLSVLGLVLLVGSFDLREIVGWQMDNTWGIVVQPVAALLFLVCLFAETGRTPFDVAEGESEIVGGFHTEYSSFKFALFFMGEYAHVVIASALMATVFLGGYDVFPWADGFLGFLPGGSTAELAANPGVWLGGLLLIKAVILFALGRLVSKQRRRYAQLGASDAAVKDREYALFGTIFKLGAIACVVLAVASIILIGFPGDDPWLPEWAMLPIVPLLQIGVVIGKTLFLCWFFVWVRWTLPRLRYDHIMDLGWKVLLNIALINLVLTAVIAKIPGIAELLD